MLVCRDDETLNALLKRLDRALGRYYDDSTVVDEVNGAVNTAWLDAYDVPASSGNGSQAHRTWHEANQRRAPSTVSVQSLHAVG
jgi:hypothetical protein